MTLNGSVLALRHAALVSLDIAAMLAGSKFRGEFEEKLKGQLSVPIYIILGVTLASLPWPGVIKEVELSHGRIILFVDEMHILVGAGGSEGAIDASNILKPALARGSLRCLGATTTDE